MYTVRAENYIPRAMHARSPCRSVGVEEWKEGGRLCLIAGIWNTNRMSTKLLYLREGSTNSEAATSTKHSLHLRSPSTTPPPCWSRVRSRLD